MWLWVTRKKLGAFVNHLGKTWTVYVSSISYYLVTKRIDVYMSQKKSPEMVEKCATEVWLRDGDVYGKKQLRACFEHLVSGQQYSRLWDLELHHVYVLAKVCWRRPQMPDVIADLLHLEPASVETMLRDLITFELCEHDGISAYLPTDAGAQFIVDLGIEILLAERVMTLPRLQKSIKWVEELRGLKPHKG